MAFDSNGNEYDPDAGSPTTVEGRCNAPLTNYEERYGEKRHCTQMPEETFVEDGSEFCRLHKGRTEARLKRAQEIFQHGIFTKTVDHLYDKLDPWQQIVAWGLFETLMDDSCYEFAPEFEPHVFDFSDADHLPSVPRDTRLFDDDGNLTDKVAVRVPFPTDHGDRAISLWCAAIDSVKMFNVQAKIAADEMETTTTEHAEFDTAEVVGEGGAGTPKTWNTIEEVTEHHLNLPYSRLVRDRTALLEYGGVTADAEESNNQLVIDPDDFNFGTQADPEVEQQSANVLSKTGESLDDVVEEAEDDS